MRSGRVVMIGLDGLDPSLVEAMVDRGELPALARLRAMGGYARLETTAPAQTPVAWSSFAVGSNPGAHGIFDFLTRDPQTYRPDVGLHRYEQKSRFLPVRAVNLRGGEPLWARLADAGVESTILRHPCTYPPQDRGGRVLAGVGVPDVRGGFGASTWVTDTPDEPRGDNEHVSVATPGPDGRAMVGLRGPLAADGGEAVVELTLQVSADGRAATVWTDGGEPTSIPEGAWSEWVPVSFRLGRLQRVHGLVRFHLVGARPLRLYVSPVQFDPDAPLFPISRPWDYAGELRRGIGRFHTLGMAEDHAGLNNGRLSEGAFLEQCDGVMRERRAMLHYELSRFERGFLYCLFDTPDRIQHMFWRFRDPDHPSHGGGRPSLEFARVIEDHYRACDDVIAEILDDVRDDTLLIVASDHGFTDFRRAVHINTWLHREGYLALRRGVEPGCECGDLFAGVDWGRTRAYAVGLAGIYLNLRGREGEGTVDPSCAEALKAEIAARLSGLWDSDEETTAVRGVRRREDVYRGPFVERAPDLIVDCAPGYRVSSRSAMGGVPDGILEDNRERWSGDHVVDPAAVPGVLFMSRPIGRTSPNIIDLAPTILGELGAPGAEAMEGDSLPS